jgi:signal transduction histidine kinase
MRLFEITNMVIDVSQNTEADTIYSFSKFSMQEVAKNLVETHNDQLIRKQLNVEIDCPVDLPEIRADKTRLQFALQILFENAIIYTPENGKIVIKIKFDEKTNEFVISVVDSGIGIEKEDIPKLFAKFFRTVSARHADTEGMGIGLYMAKNIVMKHNGRIWVDSDGVGKGSTFSFAIPNRK